MSPIMLVLEVSTKGETRIRQAPAMSRGMAGLYLVEVAARFSIDHPASRAEREWFERAMKLVADREAPPG